MLADIILGRPDPIVSWMGSQNNKLKDIKVHPGVFILRAGNFSSYFKENEIIEYPEEIPGINFYGVCDSVENILEYCSDLIASDRKFVIGLWEHAKSDQPNQGGWRWCKWGEYIGKQNSVADYLYNEPEIDRVYSYEIIELV